jgi:glucoamylase
MGRPVMLGNGGLTIGLNEQGLVHDFYYPYVGLENLTTARSMQHRIGIWADGHFSWVDDGTWHIDVDFEADALVSKIHMRNDNLGIELDFQDFVDSKYDAFGRSVTVRNLADHSREIRVFFHQVFQISSGGRADTALFVPEANYLLDYKGRCSLLIYAHDEDGQVFDQFAVGGYGIEGKEGTWRDAEDGELSGSAVEHGGVDSVLRVSRSIEGGQQTTMSYWIVAADSQYNAERVHNVILKDTLQSRMDKTREHWHNWLETGHEGLTSIDPAYLDMVTKSLLIIRAHTDKHGGIIASCDSSIYNYGRDYYSYVWPRDGAYVMWPLIRLGFTEEPKAFFRFCNDILTADGYLMHKYQPDKAIGSTWHPLIHNNRKELAIQEDETAVIIHMLGEYRRYSGDTEFVGSMYESMIRPAANFMCEFIDESTSLPHASYDLWEEKFLTSTYTVAVTYRALLTAADLAEEFGHHGDSTHWREVARIILDASGALFLEGRKAYCKGFLAKDDGTITYDNTLDVSSLYGAMMYGLHDPAGERVHQTASLIESTLLNCTPSGGIPRYEHDNYFMTHPDMLGNPWIVTTLWLAQYYIRMDRRDDAVKLLEWSIARKLPSGALTEQVDPISGSPLSVNPLVWSHAELINTVLDLSEK